MRIRRVLVALVGVGAVLGPALAGCSSGNVPNDMAVGPTHLLSAPTGALAITAAALRPPSVDNKQLTTVEFRLANTGRTVLAPDPDVEAFAYTTTGREVDADSVVLTPNPLFPPDIRLRPGDTVDGRTGFDTRPGEQLARIDYRSWALGMSTEWQVTDLAPSLPGEVRQGAAAAVGATQTVTGREYRDAAANDKTLVDQRLSVTLTRVVDPAQPADGYPAPDDGTRYAAVGFTIRDIGPNPYRPVDFRVAFDDAGHGYDTQLVDTTAGPTVSRNAIPPGGSTSGVLVLELPTGNRLSLVEFYLDVGGADSVARWAIS